MPKAHVPEEVGRVLADERATLALGARVAPWLSVGDVVALSGELGAGKTTLARGIIAACARLSGLSQEEVPSPTFSLVQVYEFGDLTLWHFDLYRLKSARELEELGWEEALSSGAAIVEWPERAGSLLPRERLDVRLDWDGTGRRAALTGRLRRAGLEAFR
ncbi:MAG: tRNA (adenosine(37)-N6)-threonylcarbamoyltransferase complex ATPase subunit type 1 TsaE [Alphaproteobacteria bacterium]